MTQEEEYSKSYFDSGINKPGQYVSYDAERFYPSFRSMSKAIKRSISAKKVLDIGCAKGFFVDVLRTEGFDAYGIDISNYAVNEGLPHIRSFLSVCDLNTEFLPYQDSWFDLIICMGTLEYVENQVNALNEINRVLKPGGVLLMTTLNEVPEGDTLRRFTKKEKEWNATFDRLGYEVDKTRAVSIISNYTKRVIEYDFINSLNKSKNKTLKIRITELLCKIGAKFLVINYLYNKQIGSGYLILGYVKKSNE